MNLQSYTVDEDSEGFVIRTKWTITPLYVVLYIFVFGGIAWTFSGALHFPEWLRYCLVGVVAAYNVSRIVRTYETTTTITRSGASPSGKFPHSYTPTSFVPLSRIVYLTYRESQNGGEDETLPAGLWAELERGSACLVPELSQAEADALALRIENRFRDVIGCAIPAGRPTGDLIVLGL